MLDMKYRIGDRVCGDGVICDRNIHVGGYLVWFETRHTKVWYDEDEIVLKTPDRPVQCTNKRCIFCVCDCSFYTFCEFEDVEIGEAGNCLRFRSR